MDGIHGTSREEHHSSWALGIKLASLVTSFYGDVWKWETPHYHPVYFMCVFFKYIGKAMLQRGNTEFSETSKIGSFQYRNLGFGANFKNPRLDPIGICGLLSFFEPTHCQDHCESQQSASLMLHPKAGQDQQKQIDHERPFEWDTQKSLLHLFFGFLQHHDQNISPWRVVVGGESNPTWDVSGSAPIMKNHLLTLW
jgi:hypothetical protein